ncbi:MAG: ABC transporter ATP-binding protein [Bryobacteraceae bacterium]|jgi:ABC-type polysaccharide/polyol phosphate transport system ATPase subunit
MAAVTFKDVSKRFTRHAGRMLLRHRLAHLFRPSPSAAHFYALRDVSFELQPGESLAIVGPNGAGKSTLLNLATSLCRPDAGSVQIEGRVAALLELGSGFHPDLTGAENVRINGALLGLNRRQLNARFDEIVDFSGVRDAIHEPLRTYSSGMVVRLAFSVAVNSDPNILIVDEVLGVGDQEFFARCVAKILEFRRAGKTMLCVSHSLETLASLCDRGLWLDHGRMQRFGSAPEVLRAYQQAGGAPPRAEAGPAIPPRPFPRR